MLPFFFRHYDHFVDRYFIHDNQSDDESLAILGAHPRVTILPLVLEGDSFVEAAFAQVNSFWWPSRGEADWVAVCNIDEFFWHTDIAGYLSECLAKGITFLNSVGYQMVSERFPAPGDDLAETYRMGVRDPRFDKPAFFSPDAITESGFGIARHTCDPKGRVVRAPRDEIRLLHYKHLGRDYVIERHAELNARRREHDIKNNYGYHYDPDVTLKRHERFMAQARDVTAADRMAEAREKLRALARRVRRTGQLGRLFEKFVRP